jgi:hypothetical protein
MTVFEAYIVVAGAGVALLVLVAQQAGKDKSCSEDPAWQRWLRRITLYTGALVLLNSIGNRMSPMSMLIVVGSAVLILGVNLLILHLRPKPPVANATEAAPATQVYDIAARARARRSF